MAFFYSQKRSASGAAIYSSEIGVGGSVITPAAGASTVTFSGAAVVGGSSLMAGTSAADFSGASIAAASSLATGSSGVSFTTGSGSSVTGAAGSSTVSFTGEAITEGGGTADPAAVWAFMLPNGKSAQQTLVEVHAMLIDLYKIHGLMAGVPLVVDQTSRVAGDIEQAITEVSNVVTVTRTS